MKGIYFGSHWMKTNDIVYLMAQDLNDMSDLIIVDTGIYSGNNEKWFFEDYTYSIERCIRWLNENKVLELVRKEHPDFIIINSGGMSLTENTANILKDLKVVTIGISLSDPDVFSDNGKIYSEYYDLFYTNSQYALENLYSKKTNIKLLPFAASPKFHRPLDIDKIYDVVVVGHARPERVEIINKLKKYFNIGLFGQGWEENKIVYGEDHVKAINSGKIYLSFSKTVAGYYNVKVGLFEAIACRSCAITEKFDEVESYFKYDKEILGYDNIEDLINKISFYNKNPNLRENIAENSYQRLLKQHTWKKRWSTVLEEINNIKKQIGWRKILSLKNGNSNNKDSNNKDSNKDDIIIVKNISKKFKIPHERKTTLRDNILGLINLNRKENYEEFWALRNVNFTIKKGESIGIIGQNGSGKSTLLKILAGVLYPDDGEVIINGKIAPFLELGIGFQTDLTAKDNVYLYGSILGMNRKEMDEKYYGILDFAELRKFENMKIKNFSSGMYARLAFATAVAIKPDILLLDEVLAVGDEKFQMKCREKIDEFKKNGCTIVLVSHSLDAIQNICDKAILLEHGVLKTIGNVWNIGDVYRELLKIKQLEAPEPLIPEDRGILDSTDVTFKWQLKNPIHLVDHIDFSIRDISNNQLGKVCVTKLINGAREFQIPKIGLKYNGDSFFLEKGKTYRWSISEKSSHPSQYKDSPGTVKIFSIKEDK